MSRTKKLTISAMAMALYLVVLYVTQSFSFGAYQIRIATSLYALAYIFPFLIIPMGAANLLSNLLFGGLGMLDMIGGGLVGIMTTSLIVFIKRKNFHPWLIALPIIFVPALFVPLWLSYLLDLPYGLLVFNLFIGQLFPGLVGAMFIQVLEKRLFLQTSLEVK